MHLPKKGGTHQTRDGSQNILRMASIVKRIPNMIVVPAHDQRAFADMAELPNVTTKGLIL